MQHILTIPYGGAKWFSLQCGHQINGKHHHDPLWRGKITIYDCTANSSFPLSHSFNDRKSVLIILLLGSVDALHYTVTATVDFVLGMYFNLTSYLCLSPVTPQAELVYWAAITGPWKFVGFIIHCISNTIMAMNFWRYSTNHAEQHKSLAQVYFSRVIIKMEVG